jgi:hypothetical protein
VKNRFQNLPFKCNLQRYAAAELCAPFPEAFARLTEYCDRLEEHYKDMMDIEFTVESGQLFILQCRSGNGRAPHRHRDGQRGAGDRAAGALHGGAQVGLCKSYNPVDP